MIYRSFCNNKDEKDFLDNLIRYSASKASADPFVIKLKELLKQA
jgi:hypothetical protein